MNERIRELARQAYIEARLDENPKWRESFVSEAAMNEIQSTMEKFAELIVQECIGVIGEENYAMLTGKAYCTRLKRHFGVDK